MADIGHVDDEEVAARIERVVRVDDVGYQRRRLLWDSNSIPTTCCPVSGQHAGSWMAEVKGDAVFNPVD